MQSGGPFVTFRMKLILLVSGTALLTALLVGGLNFYRGRAIATDHAVEALAADARLAALKVKAVYDAMRGDADVVAETPSIQEFIRAQTDHAVIRQYGATADSWRGRLETAFGAFLQARPYYTQIRLIGIADGGKELARVDKAADGRLDVVTPENMQQKGGESYFREGQKLNPGQIHYSDAAYSRDHGRVDPTLTPTIRLVLPVFRDDSKERFGMIVISANYHAFLVEALRNIETGGDIYIADSFGDYIHRTANGTIDRLQIHDNYTSPVPSFIKRFAARLQTNGRIAEDERIGYVARLAIDEDQPGEYFGVFLLAPEAMLVAGVRQLALQSLAAGLLLAAVAALAAALASGYLTRPIARMTNAIRAYTSGNTYLLDMPTKERDEIGEMARAFQSLMTRLDLINAQSTKLSTQLEAFIAGSVDGFVVINEDGIIEQVNPALLELFGYERAELIGQNVSILMPHPQQRMHDGYLRAYRELGIRSYIGTIRNEEAKRKDGSVFPISLSISEIRLADRRIFSAMIRDVSVVREAGKFSIQLEAFIANAVDGFIVINERGIIEQVNPALLDLFGYEKSELVGQNVAVLMPEAASRNHDTYLKHYRQTGEKTYIGTIRDELAQRKDGTTFPIALSISEVQLGDRRIFSAIIRDTTSIRQTQQELLQYSAELNLSNAHSSKLSAQLEGFINNAVDGFVVINEQGIIEQANPALLDLFGYEREELIGQNVAMLMPDTTASKHDAYLGAYRDTGEKTYIGTIRDEEAKRKDGTSFPIALSISELQLADRRIFSAVIRDMTAIRASQDQIEAYAAELERSNQELDQFAYVASHDLKAPLRVIDNASRWLEEDLDDKLTEEDRENMTLLRGRVKRMEKLLDDLLEYSRIGRAIDGRYQEIVTGDRLVEEVLMLLDPPASMKVEISESFKTISVIRMPLQQVLHNLINNAIKHHDHENGTIELAVIETGGWLHFAVCDDGPGIPDEFREKIFEMFHTLKPRDQVEGSGMGLALVKKAVEHFGGRVTVGAGKVRGAEFTFSWPKRQLINHASEKAA